jgi:hypothetical protein
MNITIFPTGTSGAESAVKYLLSDIDHEKKVRSVLPELLFGDPDTFSEIANATNRKHKYTSGVISFRDNENITKEQMHSLVSAFRSTFLPGLKPDTNYSDLWVIHRDKSNIELHFLYANTELTTGSQLVIHPPGQKNIDFFNAFVSVCNHHFGFAQVVPDPLKIALKGFEAKSPNGKRDKKAKNNLSTVLRNEILDGFITNRNQLIGYLKRNNIDVSTIGSDFITVKLPGSNKNTRLKGPLFKKDSNYDELIEQHKLSKIPKYLTENEAKNVTNKLSISINARGDFFKSAYFKQKNKNSKKIAYSPPTAIPSNLKIEREHAPKKEPETKKYSDTAKKIINAIKPTKRSSPLPIQNRTADINTSSRDTSEPSNLNNLSSSIGSLESQIGSLSLQRYNILFLLSRANGRVADRLKAQLADIELRLIELNKQLEKEKANHDDNKSKIN